MTLNTKDLYNASVGVGTTSPYKTIPAVAIVDEFGNQISEFSIRAGIVTVTNIVNEVEIKNDAGNPIPISDAGNSITVDGKAYSSSVTITRPANTTAYTAGDVVGDTGGSAIITLSNIGPSGGYVLLQSVRLIINTSTVPSGMSGFRLHLFTTSPTATADNAVFDLASADIAGYAGYIDLSTPQDFGSTLFTQTDYCGTLIKLANGSTTLYGELETRGAFTPTSGLVLDLRALTLEASV